MGERREGVCWGRPSERLRLRLRMAEAVMASVSSTQTLDLNRGAVAPLPGLAIQSLPLSPSCELGVTRHA